jgi:hypothetical protein
MDLAGRLSNQDLTILYQRLTAQRWTQAPRLLVPATGPAPDGRRKFGTIRAAVVASLELGGESLRLVEMHTSVEQLLGSPVARSSIKNCLARGSTGSSPLFKRVTRGRYSLID